MNIQPYRVATSRVGVSACRTVSLPPACKALAILCPISSVKPTQINGRIIWIDSIPETRHSINRISSFHFPPAERQPPQENVWKRSVISSPLRTTATESTVKTGCQRRRVIASMYTTHSLSPDAGYRQCVLRTDSGERFNVSRQLELIGCGKESARARVLNYECGAWVAIGCPHLGVVPPGE